MEDKNTFLGTGWEFPTTFNQHSGSITTVHDEVDVEQSLYILLSTMPGERPMAPTYGCDLSPLAFQQIDLSLQTFMVNNIKRAILEHEPRVEVHTVQLYTDTAQNGIINIKINYTIKATNMKNNLVYPYYIDNN